MAIRKETTTRKPPAAPAAPQAGKTAAPAAQSPAALENKGSSPATTSRRSPEEIARRAYALWQQRGAPHGSPQEDWLRAERELEGHSRH